jgi:hypothetical protein
VLCVLAPLTASACSSRDTSSAPADGGSALDPGGELLQPIACRAGVGGEPEPGVDLFDALRVAAGFDYLERRLVGALLPIEPLVVGAACGGAKDVAICKAALTALASNDTLFEYEADTAGPFAKGYYFVFSKGDVTGKLVTLADLRAVLPNVTSPIVAYAYAEANGHRVMCQTRWVREEPEGFVLFADHGQICRRAKEILFVRRDGTVDVRQSLPGSSPCL